MHSCFSTPSNKPVVAQRSTKSRNKTSTLGDCLYAGRAYRKWITLHVLNQNRQFIIYLSSKMWLLPKAEPSVNGIDFARRSNGELSDPMSRIVSTSKPTIELFWYLVDTQSPSMCARYQLICAPVMVADNGKNPFRWQQWRSYLGRHPVRKLVVSPHQS
ncbi:hypothetical protein J6590_083580 [Homalodisca vitripennis]|nr:hypothetical protein J6590_083580 [Homalodisca vitripennis]